MNRLRSVRARLVRGIPLRWWARLQWLGSLLGTIRWIVIQPARVVIVIGLPLATVYALVNDVPSWVAMLLIAVWIAVPVALAFRNARNRLIVGEFEAAKEVRIGKDGSIATVHIADLLRVEVARLADLLRVVDDRRAVSSGLIEESRFDLERGDDELTGEPKAATSPRIATGLVEQNVLDATLSVDQLTETLQGAISGQAKIQIGPFTISLGPLIQLMGRVLQSPRITGHLHQDGDRLILTARLARQRSLSWRVERDITGSADSRGTAHSTPEAVALLDQPEPFVVALVRELALRIYTDLALDPTVRWEASEQFFEGLRRFRSCLRTPRGRKVNLRHAEHHFLDALAQDENYPSAHYNLGVLYTELLGLASVAGRRREAAMHRSAAEASFGRAIEQDPERWDCHFAFAQIQLRHRRFPAVVESCEYMLRRHVTLAQELRTHELAARALLAAGDVEEALREARTASALALCALLGAKMRRSTLRSRTDERAPAIARVAAACLLTSATCYLSRERTRRESQSPQAESIDEIENTMSRLIDLSRMGDSRAALQHYFGRWAMASEELKLAEQQLREAAGSMPTRAAFAADLALARARHEFAHTDDTSLVALEGPARDEVVSPALRALQAMAGTFSPTHDERVCETLAEVYRILGRPGDISIAGALDRIASAIRDALEDESAAASSLFVRISHGTAVAAQIGPYARAAQEAYAKLETAITQRKAEALANLDTPTTERRPDGPRLDTLREALERAEEATSLNPLSAFAWETFGDAHAELSDFSNARLAWSHALRSDPDNAHLYAKLGSSFWNIAYEGGRARPWPDDLKQAVRNFEDALTLYRSDALDQQTFTRYRLAKLYSALRNLDEARRHLRIVESAQGIDKPPLVGWVNFGFACLGSQAYPEAEHYFRKAITGGEKVAVSGRKPQEILGDSRDEQLWPLSLTRAWAHLGLCLSWLERAADPTAIAREAKLAEQRLDDIYEGTEDPAIDPTFPTRARAAALEVHARLAIQTNLETAIEFFERAISQYPFSRTYLGFATALEELAEEQPHSAHRYRGRAEALVHHAVALGQWAQTPEEARRLLDHLGATRDGHMQ